MVDERRRQLERAPEGDASAWGKALRERIRQGTVAPERLRLLAYLGDPAAIVALGADAPEPSSDPLEWAQGLRDYDTEACVRIITSLARLLLPDWERQPAGDTAARRALDAAQEWLDCPCPRHSDAALEAYGAANTAVNAPRPGVGKDDGQFASARAQNAARVATFAARAAGLASASDANLAWFAGLASMSGSVASDTHELNTVYETAREDLSVWVLADEDRPT